MFNEFLHHRFYKGKNNDKRVFNDRQFSELMDRNKLSNVMYTLLFIMKSECHKRVDKYHLYILLFSA